jgi:hypothetical protein
MQCFPVKSLVHKVLGGGGVYAYIRYLGGGYGIAASLEHAVVVTSDMHRNVLNVYQLASLDFTACFGGPEMFAFVDRLMYPSGWLAFLTEDGVESSAAVVTDAGHDAVHVVDVASLRGLGFVALPGTAGGPRGVATKGDLVAFSGHTLTNTSCGCSGAGARHGGRCTQSEEL